MFQDRLPGAAGELHVAMQRHLIRLGRSPSYKEVQERRLEQITRQGFDAEAFLSAPDVASKEDVALAWLATQAGHRPPGALTNYAKLLNLLAASGGLRGFRVPYQRRREPQRAALTPAQIHHVLDTYQHRCPVYRARNLAIFATACLLGTRTGELYRLDLNHLDRDRGRVWVQASKNYVEAWVPVEPELWSYIQAWLDARQACGADGLALFTLGRAPWTRLSNRGIYLALRSMGAQVGVKLNGNITRHTRGKRLNQAGWPVDRRRYMLRHTDERAMHIYDEMEYDDVARTMQQRGGPGLRGDPATANGGCPTCGQAWPG